MSANRLSWIVVALVVLVVGFFVVRSTRRDASTRINTSAGAAGSAAEPSPEPGDVAASTAGPDTAGTGGVDGTKRSSVQRAKVVLRNEGLYTGEIDNNYDPVLAEALKKYQSAHGLPPNGYLDKKTYATMGISLTRRRPAHPPVPAEQH
jgi:peptidoglycan hydrolase-like protein with peptidoglycan-binding domain